MEQYMKLQNLVKPWVEKNIESQRIQRAHNQKMTQLEYLGNLRTEKKEIEMSNKIGPEKNLLLEAREAKKSLERLRKA